MILRPGTLLSHRPAAGPGGVDHDFAAGGLIPGMSFARASTAMRHDEDGVLELVAIDAPRFDHGPLGAASRGLMIEGERTNLFLRSSTAEGGHWNLGDVTANDGAAASPDGGTNAVEVADAATNAEHVFFRFDDPGTAIACTSIYAKAGTRSRIAASIYESSHHSRVFDLVDGSNDGVGTGHAGVAASGIVEYVDSWWRPWVTYDPAAGAFPAFFLVNTGTTIVYLGNGSTLLTWNVQLESAVFPSSPIPTVGASATRAADMATLEGAPFAALWNASEGLVVVRARTAIGPGEQVLWQADDGTEDERVRIVRDAAGDVHCIVTTGGSDVADLDLGAVAHDTDFGVALGVKANQFAASLDGAAVVTDTSGAMPAGLTTMRFGRDTTGNEWFSTIARFTYERTRPANAAIEAAAA